MPDGNGVNCKYCPEYKKNCNGNDKTCLCYKCPRHLGQCMCVKYCRETESILTFEEHYERRD
ncbi:hypothetical protein ACH36K_01055 [Clostridium sp. MB05]|uniref:hypothetical protein n=1 Tax=Clostridium sp. MB05 TaxID=3376682 RepID=UPI003982C8E1